MSRLSAVETKIRKLSKLEQELTLTIEIVKCRNAEELRAMLENRQPITWTRPPV
jgi:hypothetical protein